MPRMAMMTTKSAVLNRPHFELNRLRRTARWSHQQLADAAGCSEETIQRIELGITANPWEETKHKIADALQARLTERFGDEAEKVTVFTLWP